MFKILTYLDNYNQESDKKIDPHMAYSQGDMRWSISSCPTLIVYIIINWKMI